MTVADGYSRANLRRAYADAWRKHRAREPLTPLEALIADVVLLHPEYQPLLENPDAAVAFENAAGDGENPFFHLGLHVAVREQLAVDRPPGIRALQDLLHAQLDDAHRAEHVLAEALAETLWDAQRAGRAPDERQYLDRARRRLKG